jgi:hypothetical protein
MYVTLDASSATKKIGFANQKKIMKFQNIQAE